MPYIEPLAIGPFNSFGALVVLGVVVGTAVAYRQAERLGLDLARVHRMALFCGVSGLLGAHLIDVFLYQPGWADEPGAIWTLLNPFAGISSYGGLIGGTLGFVLFAHLSGIRRLRYADVAALGVLVLLLFGRAGCASVHDHVGVASSFALAVDFPPGAVAGVSGPHHDLGLYEFLYLLALTAIAMLIIRTPRRPGWLVAFVAVAYAVPRFFFELLRRTSSDPRYFELTPAQWSSIALLGAGIGLFVWIYRVPEPPPAAYRSPTPWPTMVRNAFRLRPNPS